MIAYSDTMENENVDVSSSSEVLSTEVGLKAEATTIIVALGFTISAEIGYVGEFETSRSAENSQAKARSRSFALGDADHGDYFDVQVWNMTPTDPIAFHQCEAIVRFSLIRFTAATYSAQ